jgi:parallel beta-helix repeat protein
LEENEASFCIFGVTITADGRDNTLSRNTSTGCEVGFRIVGTHNAVRENVVTQSSSSFDFIGDENLIVQNTSTDNASGFHIIGNGNSVTDNVATRNGFHGIFVGGQNNVITHNTAVDINTVGTFGFDLADGNPNCDKNAWDANIFGTRNRRCIH